MTFIQKLNQRLSKDFYLTFIPNLNYFVRPECILFIDKPLIKQQKQTSLGFFLAIGFILVVLKFIFVQNV